MAKRLGRRKRGNSCPGNSQNVCSKVEIEDEGEVIEGDQNDDFVSAW